jgi:hypothetical protein
MKKLFWQDFRVFLLISILSGILFVAMKCDFVETETTTKTETEPETETKIRYIDLFCGLGAFHTAFSGKFQCVLACDIDEDARKIYAANYGIEPYGDIRKLDLTKLPDYEVLCAGFPCQPFSIAGKGEGFKDAEKGNLFYEILKVIDAKPRGLLTMKTVGS